MSHYGPHISELGILGMLISDEKLLRENSRVPELQKYNGQETEQSFLNLAYNLSTN